MGPSLKTRPCVLFLEHPEALAALLTSGNALPGPLCTSGTQSSQEDFPTQASIWSRKWFAVCQTIHYRNRIIVLSSATNLKILGPCGLQTSTLTTIQVHLKPVITAHYQTEHCSQKRLLQGKVWCNSNTAVSLAVCIPLGSESLKCFLSLMFRNSISELKPDNKEESIYSTEVT